MGSSQHLLTNFEDLVFADRPYLWISFSRSGDSSEGLAVLKAAIKKYTQVRHLVETALALPPPPRPSCSPLPADDEPEGAGLSVCRQTALEALRTESDRHISFVDLAALAAKECCACGLASAPTVCADCPNLHLLQAVARHGTGDG